MYLKDFMGLVCLGIKVVGVWEFYCFRVSGF